MDSSAKKVFIAILTTAIIGYLSAIANAVLDQRTLKEKVNNNCIKLIELKGDLRSDIVEIKKDIKEILKKL